MTEYPSRAVAGHPIRTAARALIVRDGAVLAIEYRDRRGPWYLLPGGGQEHEETLADCLVRELVEELDVAIDVGPLLHVREFISSRNPASHLGSGFHQLEMIFEARLLPGEEPRLPETADRLQTGFAWIPLAELEGYRLHPRILISMLRDGERPPTYLGAIW